jgi:hypothetical protein
LSWLFSGCLQPVLDELEEVKRTFFQDIAPLVVDLTPEGRSGFAMFADCAF